MVQNLNQQFLPESNFHIISFHLDIDTLSRDQAAHYNSLAHDKLLEIDKEYQDHFQGKEARTSYTFNVGDNTYYADVFDLLRDKLSTLSDFFITMTDDEILSMLNDEEL